MSVQCMAWVLAESPTTGTDRLVLLSLANHANELGQSWPSVATIAREANASERAVQRSLANLKQAGAITVQVNAAPDERIPKDRRPNLYRILKVRGDVHGTPRGDAGGSDGVPPVTERGDAGGTQTISEPSVKTGAASPPAKGKSARKPDELFEAVVSVCGLNSDGMTKGERGRVNAACKELRDVEASPDDVVARAGRYRAKYPNSQLTPQALTNHWSALAGASGPTLARCSECDLPLGESHNDESCRNRRRILGKAG